MREKKQSDVAVLLEYAGSYKGLTFLGLGLSALAMILGMAPYICIWLVARDLIAAAPDWTSASGVVRYGWMAFGFSMTGIAVYFAALMCTHLAAFRTASNIRKQGMAHLMKAPLGFFDANASGLIRNRLDGAASETETLLAHNLADIVGSAAMVISMIVLMFVFDWRMGASCLLAAVVSVAAMFTMMGGKNARLMAEYQAAQDVMSKAGTEYVRGIPVVKVFQQTVYSFRAFKQAIEDYSAKAERYQGDICQVPQSVNLTFTEGAFVFLVPVACVLAPGALKAGNFAGFVTDFAFYAVFSAVVSTALARIMFAANGMMLASTALSRIDQVMSAPVLKITDHPQIPKDNSVEFKDVTFTYEGSEIPALDHVSFRVEPGQTVALVGPSGGGKTTAASLIPRFWDVSSLILSGQIDFMVLFMFLLAITRVYAPFDQALALIAEMFMSQISASRLMEIHDAKTAEGTDTFTPAGHDIVFENVGFAYNNEQVLRGVSFTAKEGEVTALVGPSGSGKSTCARLAARLWDVSEGSIRVGGIDINSVDPEVLLTDYSMVFQDVVLFDDTVMENIRLGRHGATDEEVLAAAAAANCDEFVKKLPQGYATPIGENGAKLSGGERQRISIARALLKNAPIVLLDEATASLDVENETKVQGALSRLLAGKTVLVIAHRMRTVEAADKIVVLASGKVAEEGSPDELLTKENGIFRHMTQLQSASAGWSI